MSPVREKFIKIIESLPYELEIEITKRNTIDILKEITQKYVEIYGIEDLSEQDKQVINSLINNNFNKVKSIFDERIAKK